MQEAHLSVGLHALVKKLGLEEGIALEVSDALRNAAGPVVTIAKDVDVAAQHSSPAHILLITSGTAGSYDSVEAGARQITAFHITGDLVAVDAFLLSRLDYGVAAMTPVTAIQFSHASLQSLMDANPRLIRILWLSTMVDAAIRRRWIVAMGRMASVERLAHLVCEHFVRSRTVGLSVDNSFPFQLTQTQLADALGISTVNVNRTLQELRRRPLLTWDDGVATILDWPAMCILGQFDETHLNIRQPAR